MKKNEKGFGLIEGLLILVIVSTLGFVSWYVWHNRANKTTSTTTSTAQKTTTPTVVKPKGTTFKVPELGIQIINVPSSLSDLSYTVKNYTSDVSGTQIDLTGAYFSTISLSNLDKNCSSTGVSDGALTKEKGTYNSSNDLQGGSPDQFVKQLSGFWISYGHPQAGCSNNSSTEALHFSQTKAFQTLVTDPANIVAL